MSSFNYYMPTKIYFGRGKIEELGNMELPGKKAMIVISAGGSMKKTGYLDRVKDLLEKRGVGTTVF